MNVFTRLLITVLAIFLASCTSFNMNNGGPCMQQCVQKLNGCKSSCTNNCPACSAASLYKASTSYSKYAQEQQIEGQNVARELNSYRDPLQCRKITCNCSADFSACTQSCTGKIQKRLQAVPYCT